MPLQGPKVQDLIGTSRQSERNLFSESTTQRRKAPPRQHFWVDREWLTSGVALFTDLPMLAHTFLYFPSRRCPIQDFCPSSLKPSSGAQPLYPSKADDQQEQISSRPPRAFCLGSSYPPAGFPGHSAQVIDPSVSRYLCTK